MVKSEVNNRSMIFSKSKLSIFHASLEDIEVAVVVCREFIVGAVFENLAVAEDEKNIAVSDR